MGSGQTGAVMNTLKRTYTWTRKQWQDESIYGMENIDTSQLFGQVECHDNPVKQAQPL
jgi:hypothetical protein